MSRYRLGGVALLLLPAISGCGRRGSTQVCLQYAAAGISVTLADAAIGGPILSGEALIVARDGEYADSVQFTIEPRTYDVVVGLAYERTGTYTVEAHVTDYRSWVMRGIRVGETPDGCHVETRRLIARLSPEE